MYKFINFDNSKRVESGPIKFDSENKGIFIRGDNLAGLNMYLHNVIEQLKKNYLEKYAEKLIEIFDIINDEPAPETIEILDKIDINYENDICYVTGYNGNLLISDIMQFNEDWEGVYFNHIDVYKINTMLADFQIDVGDHLSTISKICLGNCISYFRCPEEFLENNS